MATKNERLAKLGKSKSQQKRVEAQTAPVDDGKTYTEERFVATLKDGGQIFMALCWWGVTDTGKRHCFNYLGSVKEGPVLYAVCPIKDGERCTPNDSHTVPQFMEYLKERLAKWGGSDDAYALLGVEKPKAPPVPEPRPTQDGIEGQPPSGAAPKVSKPKRPKSDAPAIPLDEMYKQASKALGEKESALRDKYKHLNPGLQGMNLRNRMRAKGIEPKAT